LRRGAVKNSIARLGSVVLNFVTGLLSGRIAAIVPHDRTLRSGDIATELSSIGIDTATVLITRTHGMAHFVAYSNCTNCVRRDLHVSSINLVGVRTIVRARSIESPRVH